MRNEQPRMKDGRQKESIPLSSDQRGELLDRLDKASAAPAPWNLGQRFRRESKRWAFRRCDVAVAIEHPAGGVSRSLVCARNLSAGGMSFLHGGFVYPGSRCSIALTQLDDRVVRATGQVVSCRHVEGLVHEIGLKFDRHIDPQCFISAAAGQAEDDDEGREAPAAEGCVLCVDDSESDRLLLAHHLRETAIDLTAVEDAAGALESLAGRNFDVVFCGLSLVGESGEKLIAKIREDGFTGPVVLFTAEVDGDLVQKGFDAGATHLLRKPYEAEELRTLVNDLLQAAAGEEAGPPLYSSMENEPGMARLIATFIHQAGRIARKIHGTIEEGEADHARELCLNVKGTAASLGFGPLDDAASEALRALESSPSLAEAAEELKELGAMCQRLAMHGEAARCAEASGESDSAAD